MDFFILFIEDIPFPFPLLLLLSLLLSLLLRPLPSLSSLVVGDNVGVTVGLYVGAMDGARVGSCATAPSSINKNSSNREPMDAGRNMVALLQVGTIFSLVECADSWGVVVNDPNVNEHPGFRMTPHNGSLANSSVHCAHIETGGGIRDFTLTLHQEVG